MKTLLTIAAILAAVSVQAASLTLTWDNPTTNCDASQTLLTDFGGAILKYRVVGDTDWIELDVGNVETHTITGLIEGAEYEIEGIAYDLGGRRSGGVSEFCGPNPVVIKATAEVAPAPMSNFQAAAL